MAYIMFNEDPDHVLSNRAEAGVTQLERSHVDELIEQYKNTAVKDFLICVGSSAPFYCSQRLENVPEMAMRAVAEGRELPPWMARPGEFTAREGISVVEYMMEAARRAELHPFASIRMNDIHRCYEKDAPDWPRFYRENKEVRHLVPHRKRAAVFEYCLNYMESEIRDHYLAMVEDSLSVLDVDGIELDFMREAMVIGIGREHEGIAVMTAFMHSVKAVVSEAEKRRGHKIKVAVRVPSSPEKALRLGFDVLCWADEGLVDQRLSPRFRETGESRFLQTVGCV